MIASEINEGDQLLYDPRMEFSAGGIEFDFEQMPLFEDAFTTIARHGGYELVAGASAYFHGDVVYGEVQVVRSTRDLLPVLDPCGIEHLCECQLSGAYSEAAHVAGCGACRSAFDRVFLAAACSMGGSLPFIVVTVTDCHPTTFSGWAFDASTESQLYNCGGLAVKNCRCAILPVIEPLDEADDEEE